MKKQIGALVVSTIVVLVLIGLLVFLILEYRVPKNNQGSSPTESTSTEKISLSLAEADEINTVTITNAAGTFTIVNEGDTYSVDGLEGIKTSKVNTSDLISSLTGLQATRLIAEPQETDSSLDQDVLSEYGLDQPAVTIQVATVGQEERTLFLGNAAPANAGTYILYDGKIYLSDTTSLSVFSKNKFSFVDNQVTETAPDSYDNTSIQLSGSVRPAPITLQIKKVPEDTTTDTDNKEPTGDTQYSYTLTTPVERTISADSAQLVLEDLFSFYANSVAAVNPSAEEMAQFGLGEPFSILTADFDGNGFTIKTSKPDQNGYVYLMRDGSPIVYSSAANRIPWLTVQYEMLIKAIYSPSDVSDVSRLVVASTQQAFDFVLTHEDGGGMTVSCNGEELDPQTFTQLFQTITPIPPKEYTESEPTLQPALTMTISYVKEDRPPDVIQLSSTGNGSLFLTVNSKTNYTAEERLIQLILENCQKAIDGEELVKLS